MTTLARLDQWKDQGIISPEQHAHLSALARGEPCSVFLELNLLLYAGVLAFIIGLGWTVTTWSEQLGDLLILALLTTLLAACLWYCFSRAPSTHLIFDYVLYFGSLVWSVELAYLENRFHLLSGQWDLYLLATAFFYLFLAYRFDNRFVLSLALSSLAGWFGLTISHWPSHQDAEYRKYAILYSLILAAAGTATHRLGLKPHFLGTWLNIAANVLFWALLSGVFEQHDFGVWFLALLIACGGSLARGLAYREFSFVACAAVYGYIGITSLLLRNINGETAVLSYFVFTGLAMLILLVTVARRFGREQ